MELSWIHFHDSIMIDEPILWNANIIKGAIDPATGDIKREMVKDCCGDYLRKLISDLELESTSTQKFLSFSFSSIN